MSISDLFSKFNTVITNQTDKFKARIGITPSEDRKNKVRERKVAFENF